MKSFPRDTVWVWLERAGITVLVMSAGVIVLTFFPVIKEEIKYQLWPKQTDAIVLSRAEREQTDARPVGSDRPVIVPVDEDFGIIIPKIGANARVIPDVDWRDADVYQKALADGVAQAAGTARPGELGNVFLFSHSGVDFLEANRYNALFYLIDKLVTDDEIILLYRGEKFVYRVVEKKMVAPDSLEYLGGDNTTKTLTLMTCWPAGTTLKRLLVVAEQVIPR